MNESERRALLAEHHRQAYGWALSCCGRRREDAEDVLQTVYLKVLRGKAHFNGSSSFRTWLFALVRNTAADRRRSWLRRLSREGGLPAPTPGMRPDHAVERHQQEALLEKALTGLSARQREVVHLVFYQDMTIEEAAEVMGVSLGSARTHYERGKAKLRQSLKETLR